MNDAMRPGPDLDTEPVEHPAGEMALSPNSLAGRRVRALAGLTLAVGAFATVAGQLTITTVSIEA